MEKAVVLLSGGLDSCTCMAVAKSKGYEVYPISFNYHQRHSIELEGAKKIAAYYGVSQAEGHKLRVQRQGEAATEEASERA